MAAQERDDVGAQTYCRVEGSSSSGAALDKTDVALYAGAKVERSEDGSADLARRLNKRIKKTAEAEGVEVAENSVNQEDERRLWDCGSDLQWKMDDHSGLSIDVELVREARAEEVQFMEWLPVWERSSWEECQPRTGSDPVSTKWGISRARTWLKIWTFSRRRRR